MDGEDRNQSDTTGSVLAYGPPRCLILTDVLEVTDTAARNASGWIGCLGALDKLMSGVAAAGPHSADAEPFEPIYQEYVRSQAVCVRAPRSRPPTDRRLVCGDRPSTLNT